MDKPNIYPFGTPYEDIFQELQGKDPRLYAQVLKICGRIFTCPQVYGEWAITNA